MLKVQAISGATGEEFKRLENEAIRLGSTTVFTASEAAARYGEICISRI